MDKRDFLSETVKHIDITSFDASPIIDAMRNMGFSSRDTAAAADIFSRMIRDDSCTNILTLAGSTSAAGCMQIYVDMVKYGMIDVVVATGAAIVDMDFFEAIGFKHYKGNQFADDRTLRSLYIDRIYDIFIDEEELQQCDLTVKAIADALEPGAYSSREFIREMGRYLTSHAVKSNSLIQTAFEHNVPIFCPAFVDSSAGFGLVKHRVDNPDRHIVLDTIKDFHELTKIKIAAKQTGLFMIGGGVPKNFVQDTVVCAEMLGHKVPMHEYSIQITVADVRDGGCSGSTFKEASSWGKVNTNYEQMVFAEASTVLPLIVSHAYHQGHWNMRTAKRWTDFLDRHR
ncbi:MAG: deoxyhypusine synthase [Methylococcaceae bacterium]|nr:deoxyhypusine synthase [Methylococcaceae bacterium]